MSDLAGAPVLITGAARRIGAALAEGLAAAGHPVAIHYNRSGADAEAVAGRIGAAGGHAATVSADLGNEASVQALMPQAVARLGRAPKILINNASVFERDDALTASRASWDRHLEVNLRAPFVLSQALAQSLGADQPGLIVNIIDQRIWRLNPTFTSYTLSKAGLWTLTQTLAQALAPRIRVAAIGPGPVMASIHQDVDTFAAEAAHVPLQRGPDLAEITRTVQFMIATPSLTGQMVALDGGQHLAWQTPDVMACEGDLDA